MTDQPTPSTRRRAPRTRPQARPSAPPSRPTGGKPHARSARLTAALCAAAAVAAVLASAAPSSAATASAASVTHVSVHPATVGYGNCGETMTVTGSVVNIRSSWGTSAPIIGHAYYGDTFIAEYRTSYTYNGYFWAYGFDDTRDTAGYIAMAYLHDDGYPAGCTYLQ